MTKNTCVFEKYSKEILVEFCKKMFWHITVKELKNELESIQNEIQFAKASKKLENLIEARKQLDKKKDSFKSYNDYMSERVKLNEKILKYMDIQEKLIKRY